MASITVTPASVAKVSGNTKTVTSGATITAGQAIYKDTADGNKYKAAINSALASCEAEGIALNGASNGQPVEMQMDGIIAIGGTVVVGTTYVVGGTAGAIAPNGDLTSGKYKTLIGVGNTTARIDLAIKASGKQVT